MFLVTMMFIQRGNYCWSLHFVFHKVFYKFCFYSIGNRHRDAI